MAKNCSAALEAHLKGNVTTTCTCWKVTRTDGIVLGFTDHVRDVTFDGMSFVAASGYTRSAISSNASLAVDNVDIEGLITGAGITEEDCRAGIYDYAEVEVFMINYRDLTMGKLILRRGKLGELTLKDGIFTSEIRGVVQALTRNFMEVVTYDCPLEFGGPACGVDISQWTQEGTVTTVISPRREFNTDLTQPSSYWQGGEVTFTSGAANGRTMEVKASGLPNNVAYSFSSWVLFKDNVQFVSATPSRVVETGPLGNITFSGVLSFWHEGTTASMRHINMRWEYRVYGSGDAWTVGPSVVSTTPGGGQGTTSLGSINLAGALTGLLAETRYEVRIMGKTQVSSSADWVHLTGAALATPDIATGVDNVFGVITLFLPMNWDIAVGDTFTITRGCDKTPETCKSFANYKNYGGFPDVPGMDAILKTPDYRESEVD